MTAAAFGAVRDGDGFKFPTCPACGAAPSGRRPWARPYDGVWRAGGCPAGCSGRAILLAAGLPAAGRSRPYDRRRAAVERAVRRSAVRTHSGPDLASGCAWGASRALSADCLAYLDAATGGWPAGRPRAANVRMLLPADLRTWERQTGRAWPVTGPTGGLGAVILYRFAGPAEAPDHCGALQAEAVADCPFNPAPERLPHVVDGVECKRWTLGKTGGRAFVQDPAGELAECAVCEGPTTALAIAADRPRSRVVASGGELRHCLPHVRAWVPAGVPVTLYGEKGAAASAIAARRRFGAVFGPDRVRLRLPSPSRPRGWDYADARRKAGRPLTARPGGGAQP